MPNTPHDALVQALAHIDQLVAEAQSLTSAPEVDGTIRILALLKDMRISLEVAEVALGALRK